MVPDSGYREKARDDIIAVAKHYRWYAVGATSFLALIALFTLSSGRHMPPNADFIALQNPQANEYELEYMLDEVAEEASAGNSKQNIDHFLRRKRHDYGSLFGQTDSNYTYLMLKCQNLESKLKSKELALLPSRSNTSFLYSFISRYFSTRVNPEAKNHQNKTGEAIGVLSLHRLLREIYSMGLFDDKQKDFVNTASNGEIQKRPATINFVDIGVNSQQVFASHENIYRSFNISGTIVTTNAIYFAKLQEVIQNHYASQSITIRFETVEKYSSGIHRLIKNANLAIGDEIDVLRIQGKDFECEVLEKILLQQKKRGNQLPLIVEISYNYIFPPPIKFIIQTPSHLFNNLKAHYMYGCSIEYLRQDVFERAGYELVELTMEHTAIFLRRSIAKRLKVSTYSDSLSLIKLYHHRYQSFPSAVKPLSKKMKYDTSWAKKFLIDNDDDIKPFFNRKIGNRINSVSPTQIQQNHINGMLEKGNLDSCYDVTHAMGLVLSWVMGGFHKQDGILKLGCDDYLPKFTFDGDPTCSGVDRCTKDAINRISKYKKQFISHGQRSLNFFNTAGFGSVGMIMLLFVVCTVVTICLALIQNLCKNYEQNARIRYASKLE